MTAVATDFKHLAKVSAACLGVSGLILLISWQAFFNQVNDIAYDFTLRLAGPLEPSSPVQIVSIDEESLDRVGAWPWSRSDMANLVERISSGDPSVIGIDLLWDDPGELESDQALGKVIERTGNIVLATRIDDAATGRSQWRMPLDALRTESAGLGHVHADPDLDGVIRRIETVKEADGELFSALSIEVLRTAGRLPPDFEESLGASVRVVPESLMIRFAGDRGTFPQVSAWEVLAGQVSSSIFNDRMVLVGVTAEGVGDDWMTPFSVDGRRMSGIEIHANALDSIFGERTVRAVSYGFVWLILALFIGALYGADRRFEGKYFYALSLLAIPACVAGSAVLLRFFELWLPFPTFLAAIGAVVPALEVDKLMRVNRDLDRKISTLSVWEAEGPAPGGEGAPSSIGWIESVEDAQLRTQWKTVIGLHETRRSERSLRREGLLGARRHNAKWKLDAVDFFNDQLYQFVSFNKAVLESMEDVIVVSDPVGRVVYQNPAARRLKGYSEDYSEPAWEYLSGLLDGRAMIDDFARALFGDGVLCLEEVPAENGSQFFRVTLRAVAEIGLVASLHDVTAQHALNQAKNDMVSLVSHELRTPLTSIRGYGDMLMKYDLVEEKGAEFLKSILSETDRLDRLIQSFLDIAQIESGRKQLESSVIDAGPFLDEVLRSHQPLAAQKGITLASGQGNPVPRVRGDRMLLHQALSNLLTNAIKYSPAGTEVRIGMRKGDGTVRFDVKDRGYGIPPEEVARVFEKFYRRPNSETQEQNGFGLGLAFVREVAQLHGGDVTVESREGEGSLFSLWIPE